MLRRLSEDGQLAGVSHIVVDEVHERSLDSDFLLVLLKEVLPKRPQLKVVLMSATLDAGAFTALPFLLVCCLSGRPPHSYHGHAIAPFMNR